MCKNMMIAGIKPGVSTEDKLWAFLIAAAPFMNANDRDGLGYVGQGAEGLWGERWLNPADAWTYRKEWTPTEEGVKAKYKGALQAEPRYNTFGVADPLNTHAILYHARMATCEKALMNVHPFVRGNTALIHNGVIRNDEKFKKFTSTCDSEVILNQFCDLDVTHQPDKIKELADSLEGYYACGVLSTDKDGNQFLDIFRNPTANLYAYYVHELDAVVFCTSSEIVRNTCYALDWKFSATFKFTDEVMIRLNAKTGELISTHKFKANYSYGRGGGSTNWSSPNYNYSNGYGHGWDSEDYDSKVNVGKTKDVSNVIPMGADADDKKKDQTVHKVVQALAETVMQEMQEESNKSQTTGQQTSGKFTKSDLRECSTNQESEVPFCLGGGALPRP